jgi:hypothetical protein
MAAPRRHAAFRRCGGRRRVLARGQVLARSCAYDAALSSARPAGCALHGLVTCRSEIARNQAQEQTCAYGAALPSARPTGCALHGASLFLVWPRKSNQKEGHPCIRVLLRKTPLPPALLRGPSRRDIHVPSLLARHPCLASRYATPMLGLLKGTRVRAVWKFMNDNSNKALQSSTGFVGWKTAKHFPPQSTQRLVPNFANENRCVSFALPTLRRASANASSRGLTDATEPPLSGGRAQVTWKGLSGMDAARAALGQGWPVAAGPWNVTGAREPRRSRGRMQGQAFLLTFFATEKSASPSRAKPLPQPTPLIGHTSRSPSPKLFGPSPFLQKHHLPKQFDNFTSGPLNPVAPCRTFNQKRFLVCA